MKRLQEIRETDRSVKSRLSSASSRSGVAPVTGQVLKKYKRNHNMHNQFVAKEHSNEINQRNERMFMRLQEIHAVSALIKLKLSFAYRKRESNMTGHVPLPPSKDSLLLRVSSFLALSHSLLRSLKPLGSIERTTSSPSVS